MINLKISKSLGIILVISVLWLVLSFLLKHLVPSRRSNIILITLDALRPDHLGCYGYGRNTSPNIDKIGQEGIIFTQAIAQSSHTAASNSSLITSAYPNIHNVKDWGYQLNPRIPYTLAEILKAHGYTTALISDQVALSLIKGFERGFITYHTIWSSTFGLTSNRRKIIDITDWAIRWIKNNKDKNFFLWLYYLDPHGPYVPPSPYNQKFINDKYYNVRKNIPIADDVYNQSVIGAIPNYLAINGITDVDYYISQYDGEISYIDSQIGRLCEEFKKLRLDKNLIIIINSDHGEGMGEHNEYFCHGIFLYDELIRIPLIITFDKHIPPGKKIDIQVRSIDIMPTILDLLKIKKDKYMQGHTRGVSLLPLIFNSDKYFISPRFAYSEFLNRQSVRTKEWKLIYNEENNQYELYALIEDPSESNNLVLKKTKEFGYLKQKLDNYRESGDKDKAGPEFITGEERKEQLRSLGYMH